MPLAGLTRTVTDTQGESGAGPLPWPLFEAALHGGEDHLSANGAVLDPGHVRAAAPDGLMQTLRVSGKEAALRPPPPLRTARDSFPSGSSSLHERPWRDAAALARCSRTWICR